MFQHPNWTSQSKPTNPNQKILTNWPGRTSHSTMAVFSHIFITKKRERCILGQWPLNSRTQRYRPCHPFAPNTYLDLVSFRWLGSVWLAQGGWFGQKTDSVFWFGLISFGWMVWVCWVLWFKLVGINWPFWFSPPPPPQRRTPYTGKFFSIGPGGDIKF